jgi:hypothetical protein
MAYLMILSAYQIILLCMVGGIGKYLEWYDFGLICCTIQAFLLGELRKPMQGYR